MHLGVTRDADCGCGKLLGSLEKEFLLFSETEDHRHVSLPFSGAGGACFGMRILIREFGMYGTCCTDFHHMHQSISKLTSLSLSLSLNFTHVHHFNASALSFSLLAALCSEIPRSRCLPFICPFGLLVGALPLQGPSPQLDAGIYLAVGLF